MARRSKRRSFEPGPFVRISAGDTHTCALRTDGTLDCWGAGRGAPAADPQSGQSAPPTTPADVFSDVGAGSRFTCGVRRFGGIKCWGDAGRSTPPANSCGDGVRQAWEACDDKNKVNGDGCSADCMSTEVCGNGIADLKNVSTQLPEACDDGTKIYGDTCNACTSLVP
jgi:cysteine-rich repeat protein